MTDEELISRIQQGDKAATEELIYRWYPSILRYCKSRCRSRETAEDLTLCIDESRKTPLHPIEDEEKLASPRDEIQRVGDQDQICSLLKALPSTQREAIILRFGEGLTFQEIAEATGCNMRAAQGRVKCALIKMRKEISHEQ